MKELINDVITWAESKGIYSKLTSESQLVMAIGELTNEFREAIVNEEPVESIKKELGDVMVFYINHLYMNGVSSDRIYEIFNGAEFICVSLDGGIIRAVGQMLNEQYSDVAVCLHSLASTLNTKLEECLQLAHDKNTKRRHTMKDGKLVKKA